MHKACATTYILCSTSKEELWSHGELSSYHIQLQYVCVDMQSIVV